MNSSQRLKLLLTNDDGVNAEGINVLAQKLSSVADVFILAPHTNRSAVSSHIVMNQSLSFCKIKDNVYSCTGYPADCVIAALRSDLFNDIKFDAVLAGINHGSNMGTDCIYSGTVAAARQAVLYNVPGIALSLKPLKGEYGETGYDFRKLAEFVRDNINQIISLSGKDCIVSINALSPDGEDFSYRGAKMTTLCIRDYKDKVELNKTAEDKWESCFKSGVISTAGDSENEYDAVKDGYIAVTRLHAEPVNFGDPAEKKITFNF